MTQISLLPTQERVSVGEKFLNFCLTVGRYIVIGTQIVVLSCFLARFKFDRQLEDLSESIEQKQVILQSFRQQEREIRLLQTQLEEIKQIREEKRDTEQLLQNLVDLLPPPIFLEDLTLKQNKIFLTATAYSTQDLATFLNRILLSIAFREPALGEVTVDKGSIKFSLSALLTPEAFQ
jgi:Tfp pilus assembly protein PilN